MLEGWHQKTCLHNPGHVSPFLHREIATGETFGARVWEANSCLRPWLHVQVGYKEPP